LKIHFKGNEKVGRQILFGAFSALALLAGPANASVCTGTLVGTTCTITGPTITYQYDTTQGALTLFGAPDLIAGTDTLSFDPDAFIAESVNGLSGTGGSVTTTATFTFDRVYANNGSTSIVSLQVLELGDYEIETGDRVAADLWLSGTENIFTGLFPDTVTETDDFEATADTGGSLVDWSLSVGIDPSATLENAHDIKVKIQNTLVAETDANGERAFIQKKLTFAAGVVPVPSAVWLFGSALGLLAWVRRRTV
jgi:hypothetical protein